MIRSDMTDILLQHQDAMLYSVFEQLHPEEQLILKNEKESEESNLQNDHKEKNNTISSLIKSQELYKALEALSVQPNIWKNVVIPTG